MDNKNELINFDNKNSNVKKSHIFIEIVVIFTACSVLGFLFETLYVYLYAGKIVKRGMLIGPYCPIYGFAALILYFIFRNLKFHKAKIFYTFVISAISMGTFELLSGLMFKYIFNVEMWNYHDQFLSILDYTTLPILIGWGFIGIFYVFILQKILLKIAYKLPFSFLKTIVIIILIIYLTDSCISIFRVIDNPEILYNLVNP